jgi:RNA-directed DNA polymerase
MHENRETSKTPVANQTAGRWAKVTSRNARAHVFEGSDSDVVLVKCPNKTGQPVAEGAEGRSLTKENTHQSNTQPTQSGERVSQGLAGVRRAATVRKGDKFTALLHHVTIGLLRDWWQVQNLSLS